MTQNKPNCNASFFKKPFFTHIAVALVTGFVAVFGQYMLAKSNEQIGKYSTDNQTIVSLIGKVTELQEQVSKQSQEMERIRVENSKLRRKITRLESLKNYDEYAISAFFKFMPIPAWLKVYDPDEEVFIMRRINRAYEDEWDIANIAYRGKTDWEIWDDATAKMFESHDSAVLDGLSPIITIERIPNTYNHPDEGKRDWIVAKFPVSFNGVQYNAVGGIAIPNNIRNYVNFPKDYFRSDNTK